jgi:hypothetical protein
MNSFDSKKRIIILLVVLVIVALPLIYFFVLKSKPQKLLEIKIVSNFALCSSNNADMCPEAISLLRIYEGEDVVYYPSLRVKRLDISNAEAEIMLSRNIVADMDRTDVQTTIRNAVNDEMPSLACKPTIDGAIDFSKDTLNIRHFFLVPQGDRRLDEKLYFDRIDKISTHIERLIERDELFSKNQKPDAINVIILREATARTGKEEPAGTAVSMPLEKESDVSNEYPVTKTNDLESNEQVIIDDVPPTVDAISVDHDGGRNIISWESNYDDAEYEVSIACDEDCYDDGTDYSYTTQVSGMNSIQVDLSSKWDNIKQRKFLVRVSMTRAGKTSVKVKKGVKLFCK